MPKPLPTFRSHITLALSVILHAFTHAYGAMLVPLYISMKQDLRLSGIGKASLVVTLYGIVYNLGSYFAGMLADRFNRKVLLSIGLIGNAAAIAGIGLTRQYDWILIYGILAGVFGTIFHPAAAALAPSHYPKHPGMAIGLLAMGSGLGFFFGPQIAGWRANSAAWHFASVAQWQKPCIELGIVGIFFGILFLIAGADPMAGAKHQSPVILGPTLRKRVVKLAAILMFRDFSGVAALSLASIYVQRAFGKDLKQAGLMVGLMMLPSVVVNPLFVFLSGGKRRLPTLSIILVIGGLFVVTTPLWPVGLIVPILCTFQTMQLSSYAVSDAAMYERIDPAIRGRVAGLFLVVAGTFGALGPWVMGYWTDKLGANARYPHAYFGPFGFIALCMFISSLSPRLVAKLGPAGTGPSLAEEIMPATMEG